MRPQRLQIIVLLTTLAANNLTGIAQESGKASTPSRDLVNAVASIKADELLTHIKKLASDEFEGRGTGTRGDTLTVNYLTERFKHSGLRPGNPDGTFVQKVPLVGYLA